MRSATFNLTNIDYPGKRYAIQQGATFDWLSVELSGDWSSWSCRGQIRNNYEQLSGEVKASFQFLPVVFDSVLNKSIIRPTLSALVTEGINWSLTPRRTRTETPRPGINCWVYDIEVFQGATVYRIVEGLIEISLEVTV
jgi:hypothetical protein